MSKVDELEQIWLKIKKIVLRGPITGRQGAALIGQFESLLKDLKKPVKKGK